MKLGTKFLELDKAVHDRISFDCGAEELNVFFKTKAAKHMKVGVNPGVWFICQPPTAALHHQAITPKWRL